MFFEPMDFVFDDVTKGFICATVEEKLRLLMLKGWRKGCDEEIQALSQRVQELEAENSLLQKEAAPLALDAQLDGMSVEDIRHLCHDGRPHSSPARGSSEFLNSDSAGFVKEAEEGMHGRFETPVNSRATQTITDELRTSRSRRNSRQLGGSFGTSAHISEETVVVSKDSPDIVGAGNTHLDLNPATRQLEQKCRLLEGKVARLVEQLSGRIDDEVINQALLGSELLERQRPMPQQRLRAVPSAFDRLYADAQARIQRMRERCKEVQDMQAAEVRRCTNAVRDKRGRKKVEQLQGLHSNTVACATAFHEALESFHLDDEKAAAGKIVVEDKTDAPPCKQKEDSQLIRTGVAVLEHVPGAAEFATPTKKKCFKTSHVSSEALGDTDAWRSVFAESPPKQRFGGCSERVEAAGMSQLTELPREIQVLAEKVRHEQRWNSKACNAEGVLFGIGDGSRIGSVVRNSRSLPSLQRFAAVRCGSSNRRSPQTPALRRPASTPGFVRVQAQA
jgi:hypothetical protein